MARLIVLDSVIVDLVLRVAGLPSRGGDVESDEGRVVVGGGLNVARAARRQGVEVAYAGHLGRGPFATSARDALDAADVEVIVDPTGERDLGVCVVLVDPVGERTFVTSPGAELDLSADDLRLARPRPGDVVYASGYNLVYPSLAAAAGPWLTGLDQGVILAFDGGARVGDIPESVLAPVLERVDWLLLNRDECRVVSGATDVAEGARRLAAATRRVVVHDGARGCWVARDGSVVPVEGFPVVARDTNGAGDVHNGVFLAGLLRGEDAVTAARRANLAAALVVQGDGPAAVASAAEIDAAFASAQK